MSYKMEVVTASDLAPEITEFYKNGMPRGDSTGWPSVDSYYTVLAGQWTLVTGIPSHGKSEWLDALMVNLADKAGWNFVIYSPENHPHEMHIAKLAEKWSGKPFNDGLMRRMTPDIVAAATGWMDLHFRFLRAPKDNPQPPSMASILEAARLTIEADDKKSDKETKWGIVIDPWNEIEHKRPNGRSETEYISEALSVLRQFARNWRVHVWLVAHPTKMERDKNGKRPVPTPYDVSGSAHFYNKADNCITVWRDPLEEEVKHTEIHIQKIRFKNVGSVGRADLKYDRVTGRYSELFTVIENRAKEYQRAREPGDDDEAVA